MAKPSKAAKARADLAGTMLKPVRVDVGNSIPRRGQPKTPTRAGRQRLTILAGMYHSGFSYKEIALQTGLSAAQVRRDVIAAEMHYHLADRYAKVVMRLDGEAVPLAVDHLIDTLESDPTDAGDKDRKDAAMYRTLEGRGLFRQFGPDSEKGNRPATMALQVNFSAPAGTSPVPSSAQIVGVSRAIPERRAAAVLSLPGREEGGPHADAGVGVGRGVEGATRAAGTRQAVPADFAD